MNKNAMIMVEAPDNETLKQAVALLKEAGIKVVYTWDVEEVTKTIQKFEEFEQLIDRLSAI